MHQQVTASLERPPPPCCPSPILPKAERLQKRVALRLSEGEKILLRKASAKLRAKNPFSNDEKSSLLAVYDKFFERSKELEGLLGDANGETEEIKKELASVDKTKKRIASKLNGAVPSILLREEEELLCRLEIAKGRKKTHLTREEEVSVFRIYSRASKRARQLNKILIRGSMLETLEELATAREVIDRIADLVSQANYRLVCAIARRVMEKYAPRSMGFQDLVNEGALGQMKATEKFDYKLGYRYSTYATWWIRQSMTRAICDQDRIVRLPSHTNDALAKITAFAREFRSRNEKEPTAEQISKGTGIAEDKVEKALRLRPYNETCELDKREPDPNSDSPIASIAEGQLSEALGKLVESLKPIEADILRKRFGFDGEKKQTLNEIGEHYRLSRERIRQIEAQAINKLRPLAMQMGLDSLL